MVLRPLFGGALEAVIPQTFTDVSTLRQVPDNQEVFAHADTDRSIIIELLEAETDVPSAHADPAMFHWGVLERDSGALGATLSKAVSISRDNMSRAIVEGDPNVSVSLAYGTHRVAKFKDTADKANTVRVALACVRLPRVTTDLLVVLNDPVEINPSSSSAEAGATVAAPEVTDWDVRTSILMDTLTTLVVKNWGLFG